MRIHLWPALLCLLPATAAAAGPDDAAIRESVAGVRRARSRLLAEGVSELLRNDATLVRAFYEHPQIWSLYRGDYDSAARGNRLPSYIPARSFAMSLLDLAARGRDSASTIQSGPEASA